LFVYRLCPPRPAPCREENDNIFVFLEPLEQDELKKEELVLKLCEEPL
jgi:hypothetical protein